MDIINRNASKDGIARILFYNDIQLQNNIGKEPINDFIKSMGDVGGIEGVKKFQEL